MPEAWLVPLSGPTIEAIALAPRPHGVSIGRHTSCDVRLPVEAEQVSRFHARFDADGEGWTVSDLASRWGTLVNGVRLASRSAMPLGEGDVIGIAPWSFAFSYSRNPPGLRLNEDLGQTVVRSVDEHNAQPLADDLLKLLLEAATKVHAAGEERQLAAAVLRFARRGTGLPNAVLLRPVDGLESFVIIAAEGETAGPSGDGGAAAYSRTLVNAAASGNVAEVIAGGTDAGAMSPSLVQMNVSAALCAPLMLGSAPAAFLYLDARNTLPRPLRPNAAAFVLALARLASLALANLKRVEMERRQARLDAELNAAAAAQRWILPRRELEIGRLRTLGESRPGAYVGGDFFDVIPLPDGRVAVALGDVSGKGVSAGVLMTLTQGFLHAALLESGDPAIALTRLNAFIAPRRPSSKFVTLWCAVIDPAAGALRYVDAAHSYALLCRPDGRTQPLSEGGGLPIGVMDDGTYDAIEVPIAPGDRVVIVSDGIVEQPAGGAENRVEFGVEGVQAVVNGAALDVIAGLFDAVVAHANGDALADDATALCVQIG